MYQIIFCVCFIMAICKCTVHNLGECQNIKLFKRESPRGFFQDNYENLSNSSRHIVYYYYGNSDPLRGYKIRSDNINALHQTTFNSTKDTIFSFHGIYIKNKRRVKDSSFNSYVRKNIFRHNDVNLFVVEWSAAAGTNYLSAVSNVKNIGEYVASLIRDLSQKFGLGLSKVHFVGFSLGAHVAGCAGAALDGQIDTIVALDPGGILFTIKNKDNRLDADDARFVQVIHTNDALIGFDARLGHADYYPNGGKQQPGCGLDYLGNCSHPRAFLYYAESLSTDRFRFVAQRCQSYLEFTTGKCNGPKSVMGMLHVDTSASGMYFLDTNENAPYAKG